MRINRRREDHKRSPVQDKAKKKTMTLEQLKIRQGPGAQTVIYIARGTLLDNYGTAINYRFGSNKCRYGSKKNNWK